MEDSVPSNVLEITGHMAKWPIGWLPVENPRGPLQQEPVETANGRALRFSQAATELTHPWLPAIRSLSLLAF